jgi:hypothetical protein
MGFGGRLFGNYEEPSECITTANFIISTQFREKRVPQAAFIYHLVS